MLSISIRLKCLQQLGVEGRAQSVYNRSHKTTEAIARTYAWELRWHNNERPGCVLLLGTKAARMFGRESTPYRYKQLHRPKA